MLPSSGIGQTDAVATYDDDIDETVRTIWDTMFDLPLVRIDPLKCPAAPAVTGVVVLDGDFEGAVEVGYGRGLALRITQAMFACDDEPSADDISDALGEMSNMIAGNLKTSLPGHNSIGLPIMAFGTDYELSIPRSRQVGLVTYLSDGECLRVSMMQQDLEK
jgi:chemotaxis protein CheX